LDLRRDEACRHAAKPRRLGREGNLLLETKNHLSISLYPYITRSCVCASMVRISFVAHSHSKDLRICSLVSGGDAVFNIREFRRSQKEGDDVVGVS
jgi:hypothetical protein